MLSIPVAGRRLAGKADMGRALGTWDSLGEGWLSPARGDRSEFAPAGSSGAKRSRGTHRGEPADPSWKT